MTKHNGKARKSGAKVGQAIMAAHKKGGPGGGGAGHRHTTDMKGAPNMQSVVERNDLDELMAMADLAGRDFTAERSNVIVISTGSVSPLDQQRAAEARAAAEARHQHRLRLPRRPSWDETTTPEQLDTQERTSFLSWRRELAHLEEEEKLVLTPFEKNLEVWRQLWRVLERSDIVVQVVDARDPLLYRCEDLEAYARELHASKASLLLLNKADLLPPSVRETWANYLDKVGIPYAFWSAFSVMEETAALKAEASDLGMDWHELREERMAARRLSRMAADAQLMSQGGEAAVTAARRIRILGVEELLDLLESHARQAVESAGPNDPRAKDNDRKLMVGLVGYPNVGKSSTINALFGAKKTAVAPTPGKTKHFQTLIVSPTLCLCDCPGLVMPKFAKSKAQMVAAGVIPIDRLTEIRAPVEVVAERVGRQQVEDLYGFKLPPAAPNTPPTAAQLLKALALLRGWTIGQNLPDESRAGRQLLKDYTAGKLLYCTLPPNHQPRCYIPYLHDPETLQPLYPTTSSTVPAAAGSSRSRTNLAAAPASASETGMTAQQLPNIVEQGPEQASDIEEEGFDEGFGEPQEQMPLGLNDLDAADLDLLAGELQGLGMQSNNPVNPRDVLGQGKARRAEHKFQKKPSRSNKSVKSSGTVDAYDGGAMRTGKKGGLVRVGGY